MLRKLGTLGKLGMSRSGSGIITPQSLFPDGATWNETSDSYTTIGRAPYYVHDAMQPCLVTPGAEGTSDIVLMKTDYTKRVDTGATVALDGSQGQVMMRIPKFWYRYDYSSPTHQWEVSPVAKSGFTLHPAFVKGEAEMQYRYIGIYEACGYDVSAGAYIDGDGGNSWLDRTNDKLGSIVGKKPISAFTRAEGRKMAANVGTGWQMMDFNLHAMLKLLYITKYADLDSQTVLGAGNTRWSGWDFATCISATGKVLTVTAPGQSTAGGDSSDYCTLLGMESPFGDIWEWADGWNILDGTNYICTDPAQFADDVGPTSAYSLYGAVNAQASGWQATLQPNIGFLPASVGGSNTTKITDYYWYYSDWRVAGVGGSASHGSGAGLFALYADGSSSGAGSAIGGRLCF